MLKSFEYSERFIGVRFIATFENRQNFIVVSYEIVVEDFKTSKQNRVRPVVITVIRMTAIVAANYK